jgi:hypothetical protein
MSDFPENIFEPIPYENVPGSEYDPLKKSAIYAERLNDTNDEVIAIQTYIKRYKIFVAKVFQTGDNDLELVVIENTLGFVPIFNRGGVGYYQSTDEEWGELNSNKILYWLTCPSAWPDQRFALIKYSDEEKSFFISTFGLNGVLYDDCFTDGDGFYWGSLEIRVYE